MCKGRTMWHDSVLEHVGVRLLEQLQELLACLHRGAIAWHDQTIHLHALSIVSSSSKRYLLLICLDQTACAILLAREHLCCHRRGARVTFAGQARNAWESFCDRACVRHELFLQLTTTRHAVVIVS